MLNDSKGSFDVTQKNGASPKRDTPFFFEHFFITSLHYMGPPMFDEHIHASKELTEESESGHFPQASQTLD